MKGLVLAAGQGTRMAELHLKHKSLAVVNKKHVIDFSLDLLTEIKNDSRLVESIILVVGHNADAIINYVGTEYNGVPVEYVFQNERKGIAHAILTARDSIADDFILCLADEILFNSKLPEMIQSFLNSDLGVLCGVVVDDKDFSMKPIAYDMDANEFFVSTVREKPEYYANPYRGIGECIFRKETLSFLDELKPNQKRGEYEMGDFIQLIINKGLHVKTFTLADGYMNVNYAKDLTMANKVFEEQH